MRIGTWVVAVLCLAGCGALQKGYFNPGNEKCLESKRVPVTYYTCDEYRRSDGACLRQSPQTRMDQQCVRWQCKPGYENDKSGECVKPKV